MADAVAIVGNNVAALVAAQSLAARGRSVMLVNPGDRWGGHFGSVDAGAYRFDPGMVLYEFSAFNTETSPDVMSYDPDVRNDCGRFTAVVREYIERRLETVTTPAPEMFVRGRRYPDVIIGNRLDALRLMDPDDRRAIADDLQMAAAQRRPSLHPSQKTSGPAFDHADFTSVSLANHGRAFHDWFVEPLCRKILGVSTGDILARYHRVAWLPLYYPETLRSQFGPEPQRLPAPAFHYPIAGTAGALATTLAAEIESDQNIRVLRSTVLEAQGAGPFTLTLADGTSTEAVDLVWGLEASSLIAARDPGMPRANSTRSSIGLGFIAVSAGRLTANSSTLFVLDPEHAVYRVTDQDACARADAPVHRLAVEFSLDAIARRSHPAADAWPNRLRHELVEIGVIDSPESVLYCSVRPMKNVLTVPSRANRDVFEEQRAWLARHCPGIRLVGPAAGFLASSMNDQIVQGLKIGAELGGATA